MLLIEQGFTGKCPIVRVYGVGEIPMSGLTVFWPYLNGMNHCPCIVLGRPKGLLSVDRVGRRQSRHGGSVSTEACQVSPKRLFPKIRMEIEGCPPPIRVAETESGNIYISHGG